MNGFISISVILVTNISPSLNSTASCTFLTTLTLPSTVLDPTPIPFTISSLITCTFIKFVVPLIPTGTPAVITTNSPLFMYPAFLDDSIEFSITSSVFPATSALTG